LLKWLTYIKPNGSSAKEVTMARSRALDPCCAVLDSMYRCEPQLGSDGQLHAIDHLDARIGLEEGALLIQLHATLKSQRALEIGLGHGSSTVFFMMAMQRSRAGYHITIDPYQHAWHGIG
jgi:hypothetical protein